MVIIYADFSVQIADNAAATKYKSAIVARTVRRLPPVFLISKKY